MATIRMQKFDSINVIPFIDIMLVLLAIVLTTATFINNGSLEISLPKAVSDSKVDSHRSIEIAIDKNHTLFLDGDLTSLDDLQLQLEAKPKDVSILLRVDESVPFNRFVSVIDLLKTNNLDNVSVLTQKITNNESEFSRETESKQ